MAENESRLCMGCMSPLHAQERCDVCGYDNRTPANPEYLPPETRLQNDHYMIGKVFGTDPEGVWYVGYDLREEMRVWIREYAPANITRRDYQDHRVLPLTSSEAQYKALMSDFEDICNTISMLPAGEKVIPITDMFSANNTMYAVYRYLKTITLESFIERSGGKLSWRHTKKLLMPLYHTVSIVHKAGLIHRGLSPQTIYLDQSGALWLGNFTVSAARTNKSELSAQLFAGYSAPEQYSLNSWQGTWTDVYALGALTYRIVMGETPPDARERVYGDDLIDGQIINAEMTPNVVSAINKALAVEVEDRTQTAEAFIAELLANEGSNTAVYTAPAARRSYETEDDNLHRQSIRQAAAARQEQDAAPVRTGTRFEDYDTGIDLIPVQEPSRAPQQKREARPAPRRNTRRKKAKKAHPVLSLVISALIATTMLGFAVYWITNNYLADLINPPSSSEESGVIASGVDFADNEIVDDGTVPKFVGANADSIRNNAQLNERFELVFKEAYNDDYETGVVFEQQPVEGTKMPNAGQIMLFVSKGTEQVEMPAIVDLPLEDALRILDELEIKYAVIEVFNNTYEPGVIVSTDKEPGTMLDKNKDTVILRIKKETEASSEAKSSSSKKTSSKATSSARIVNGKKQTVSIDENGNKVIFFEDVD